MHIAAHVTFRVMLHLQNSIAAIFEEKFTIKAELVIRVPAAPSASKQYRRKTVGD